MTRGGGNHQQPVYRLVGFLRIFKGPSTTTNRLTLIFLGGGDSASTGSTQGNEIKSCTYKTYAAKDVGIRPRGVINSGAEAMPAIIDRAGVGPTVSALRQGLVNTAGHSIVSTNLPLHGASSRQDEQSQQNVYCDSHTYV